MVSAWIVSTVAVSFLVVVASNPCVPPGELLNGSSGFFSSPKFPLNFPSNSDCTWNITVPAGRIIKVTFFSFTLKKDDIKDCTGSSANDPRVFITNVASDDDKQNFQMCGQQLPYPVYSDGSFIQVRLLSTTGSYKGFNASYEAIDREQICPKDVALMKPPGVITSPFYPRKYPDNQTCAWKISAEQGHYVKLVITLNMQSCTPCNCDYLQFPNGFSDGVNQNERICDSDGTKTFYSTQRSLDVLFVSDTTDSKLYDGFEATYTQLNHTPPICPTGAIPLNDSGKFSSPNYPVSNYSASRDCSWNITEPPGKVVKLKFTELALGSCEFNCSSGNCTYVELYDGSSANSSSLGRFCNGSALQEVISSGNQMFVIFHSGSSLDRGFEAQYSMFSPPPTTTVTTTTTTTTTATATTKTTTTTATTIKPSTTAEPSTSTLTVVLTVVGVILGVGIVIGIAIAFWCLCVVKKKRKPNPAEGHPLQNEGMKVDSEKLKAANEFNTPC